MPKLFFVPESRGGVCCRLKIKCLIFKFISLNECVGETLDLLKHSVSGNIVVESFCGAEQDRINGNADLVRRLLMNLGINAAEAMLQGGTIRIKTANCDFSGGELPEAVAAVQPGKYVCLEVSDTGKGIEPAVMSRIFEAAFSTKPFGGGNGVVSGSGGCSKPCCGFDGG